MKNNITTQQQHIKHSCIFLKSSSQTSVLSVLFQWRWQGEQEPVRGPYNEAADPSSGKGWVGEGPD